MQVHMIDTFMAITATAIGSVVGVVIGMEGYLPYLLGGITLVGYMVSINELRLFSRGTLSVIAGVILIGYLTEGFTLILAEFILVKIQSLVDLPSFHQQVLIDKFIMDTSNLLSFLFAGLSRNIFLAFFTKQQSFLRLNIKYPIKKTKEREE